MITALFHCIIGHELNENVEKRERKREEEFFSMHCSLFMLSSSSGDHEILGYQKAFKVFFFIVLKA